MSSRNPYNPFGDPYTDKFIGTVSGRPIGEGEVDFTIDGKTLGYRDPNNVNDDDGTNSNSYGFTNPLYAYSYGDIRDAGLANDIQNVDEPEEVDKLLTYLSMPRTPEAEEVEDPLDEVTDPTGYDPIIELSTQLKEAAERDEKFTRQRMAGGIFEGMLPGDGPEDTEGSDYTNFFAQISRDMQDRLRSV